MNMTKTMWMVRAGEDAYLIDDFLKKKYVAIGWNKLGNIGNIKSKEKLKELVKVKYDSMKKSQLSATAGQTSRFLFEFKQGDFYGN